MFKAYYVSTPKVTGCVLVDEEEGTIIITPPIWQVFIGQPFGNLIRWLKNATVTEMEPEEDDN